MLIDGEAPATVRIDPSQFMLTKDNHRLMSAPVLSDAAASVPPDPVLPRTPEMDDIPEHVQNVQPISPYTRYIFTMRCCTSVIYGGLVPVHLSQVKSYTSRAERNVAQTTIHTSHRD